MFIVIEHGDVYHGDGSGMMYLAEVLEATTTPSGKDNFGKLSGGHIQLSCHIRPGHERRVYGILSLLTTTGEMLDCGLRELAEC